MWTNLASNGKIENFHGLTLILPIYLCCGDGRFWTGVIPQKHNNRRFFGFTIYRRHNATHKRRYYKINSTN